MKRFLQKLKAYPFVRQVARQLIQAARLVRWNTQSLILQWRGDSHLAKRLLVIYDFASQPFSIGDILMYQEASLVLRSYYAVDRVDFAVTYDSADPVVADPAFSAIGPENFLSHLTTVLQAAQVNPHLGSAFLFDSHERAERFVSRHLDVYKVWPPLLRYVNREYLYYHIFNDVLFSHFQKFGNLPHLTSRRPVRAWAETFIDEHVAQNVAVTVQLRRNPANPARNSDYDAWRSFFRESINRYPVRFIVICARHEMDAKLGEFSNVVFAKDYCTSVEQDLALIEIASMHIGASSGPGVMAIFNTKPYCFFNTGMRLDLYKGLIQEGNASRLFFSSPQQRFVHGRESTDFLISEFDRMWSSFKGRASINPSADTPL